MTVISDRNTEEQIILSLDLLRDKGSTLENSLAGVKGDLAGVKFDLAELNQKLSSLERRLDYHIDQNDKALNSIIGILENHTKKNEQVFDMIEKIGEQLDVKERRLDKLEEDSDA